MQIVTLEQLRSVLDKTRVMDAIRQAFIGHHQQCYVTPMPGQLLFDAPAGDCHIKYGYAKTGELFVIKIASGFYGNAAHGLPVNNGMVMVFSKLTGAPIALLQDAGWLTSWRTAAAGALAASLVAARQPSVLGIFGAGHQAEQQALWISASMSIQQVCIWAPRLEKAQQLAQTLSSAGLSARACLHTGEVLDKARLIVTTTPSTQPLFSASQVQPGTHIIALGADSPGKQELDSALFGRASLIVTDDHVQCLDHGDLAHAVKAGVVAADADISLGVLLENPSLFKGANDDISIVDLTGIPAQDIESATAFCRLLGIVD